jgi:hypothetical protein
MSDNPQFDEIFEQEFGSEDQFLRSVYKHTAHEILQDLGTTPVSFELTDGTIVSLSEGQLYELAALATNEFNWHTWICSQAELVEIFEHVMKREMPEGIQKALANVCENSDFWQGMKASTASFNILLSFFLVETGVLALEELQEIVNHNLNFMADLLQSSEGFAESKKAEGLTAEELLEEIVEIVEQHPELMTPEQLNDLRNMMGGDE